MQGVPGDRALPSGSFLLRAEATHTHTHTHTHVIHGGMGGEQNSRKKSVGAVKVREAFEEAAIEWGAGNDGCPQERRGFA